MATENSPTENLSSKKKEIASQLSEDGYALFYGAFPSKGVSEICWDKEIGGDWREFVRVAKKLEIPVLYIDWIDFTEDYFNEEMPEAGFEGEDEDPAWEEQCRLERERFVRYLGMTGAIWLGYFIGNTFHLYEHETQWYQDFRELVDAGHPPDAEENEEEEERARERTETWAENLSKEPEFASLKRRSEKRSLLRKLAGTQYKVLREEDILWQADAIHAEIVREAADEKLAKQAKELRAQKMSILAIAGKLGISGNRVTMLLARVED